MKNRGDWDPVSDEDEKTQPQPGHPNAYWADVRAKQALEEMREAGYGGDYRGVPLPKAGPKSVSAKDTHGSYDLCWCGEPADHDWPGKDRGRKHPRTTMRKDPAMSAAQTEAPRIDKKHLKTYHDELVDVIVRAVNDYGVRYRLSNNGCILYPPDGTQPYTIYARNNERQVRAARKWFIDHVVADDGKATLVKDAKVLERDMDMRERTRLLAEKLNSPEHEVPPPEEEAAMAAEQATDEKAAEKVGEKVGEIHVRETWETWKNRLGEENDRFETNGVLVRCRACVEEGREPPYTTPVNKTQGIMGHWMTNHDQSHRAKMYGAESQDKKRQTNKDRRVAENLHAAIALMYSALGEKPPTGDDKRVKELTEQVNTLTDQLQRSQSELTQALMERDEALKVRDEARARMDLLREVFKE